ACEKGSAAQPAQRTCFTTYMLSAGNPSAASRRVAATSVYTSGLLCPYLTLTMSPSANSQSNLGVVPDTGPGLKVQSTTSSTANDAGPSGFRSSFASSIGVGGSSHTRA